MSRPPIFIELCAGTAALSLRLQGGPKAKPPVSRMGAKTGYADAILAVLGLYPGQGAESYLWCEPDDGVRGLLMAYPQPEVLRAAAAILRGWKDEEPRALWERLRAELKAGASVEGAEGVARFVQLLGANRLIPGTIADDGRWVNAARDGGPQTDGGVSFGGEEFATSAAENAERLTQVPPLPPTFIARDGRAVTPEEVAGWCFVQGNCAPGQDRFNSAPASLVEYGVLCNLSAPGIARVLVGDRTMRDRWACPAIAGMKFPPVTLTADARALTPPKLPPGVICYADPPYLNTTGYKNDLPRSEVVRMARLWADAGATVCISEAEPIPDLVADGWHAVEISATRKGQKRTFSKQQAEWLTLSRLPSFVPRQSLDLFAWSK